MSFTLDEDIQVSTSLSEKRLKRFYILEKKIKEKYKNTNFCFTNGSKMNFRLYDSSKEFKTFTFVKAELSKTKENLLKDLSIRHKRCLQVENQITEKKEPLYFGSISSIHNTVYSINKEYSAITQKYKKELKSDDEISLLSNTSSIQTARNAAKYGSYFHEFTDFCDYKKQFLEKIDKEVILELKRKSKFTKDFLNFDFNVFSQKFKITQKEFIEYKLLIDYLEVELKPHITNSEIWYLFCRMKSSFILFAVSFYKCELKCLPTGVTSYYSFVQGNFKLFSNIVENMLMFKRFFDVGNYDITIEDFLSNIKIFGCDIDVILDIYENFDCLLEVMIRSHKYDDYRDYLIRQFKTYTKEFRDTLEKMSLGEHDYAISVTVKKFMEDYTKI